MKIFDPLITGSLVVSGSATVTGDLTVGGTINATISGTTSNANSLGGIPAARYALTGSNVFRGDQDITGSLSVGVGGVRELLVNQTGVTIGNIATDIHQFTGSFSVTGALRIPTAAASANIVGTAAGQLFYNTTDTNIYRYNGSAWVSAAGTSGTSGTSGSSGSSGTSV